MFSPMVMVDVQRGLEHVIYPVFSDHLNFQTCFYYLTQSICLCDIPTCSKLMMTFIRFASKQMFRAFSLEIGSPQILRY